MSHLHSRRRPLSTLEREEARRPRVLCRRGRRQGSLDIDARPRCRRQPELLEARDGTTHASPAIATSGRARCIAVPADFSEADFAFAALQADVRKLLAGVGHQGVAHRGVTTKVLETIPVEFRFAVHSIPSGNALLSIRGSTRDVTIMRLSFLAILHDETIRRCPEPQCGRLFYRVRRQLYCSRQCVARANKRAEREQGRRPERAKPRHVATFRSTKTKKPTSRRQPSRRNRKGAR